MPSTVAAVCQWCEVDLFQGRGRQVAALRAHRVARPGTHQVCPPPITLGSVPAL